MSNSYRVVIESPGIVDVVEARDAADDAAVSQAAAAVSAAAALVSQTAAAASEATATTQAGIATTKASEAAASETAAETARDEALASATSAAASSAAAGVASGRFVVTAFAQLESKFVADAPADGQVILPVGGIVVDEKTGNRWERVTTGEHLDYTGTGGVKFLSISRTVDSLGATGDGTTDDSAAFSAAALAGGKWALRSGASYRAANVTLSVDGTSFACEGVCNIIKNANGPIFSGPATDMDFTGIIFRGGPSSGSGLTGDNLDFTGARNTLTRCASVWSNGRALKSAAKISILAPIGPFQTDDTGATGYDIEIGNSVTATSYASIQDVVTSQATGGVLFVNPGMVFMSNCQIGKLTTQNIGSPSGLSGGVFASNRILGAVSVGVSNTILVENVLGAVSLTLESGVTGCYANNIHAAGSSVVNNSGNQSNTVIRHETSVTSSMGLTSTANVLRQGDDATSAWLAVHPATNIAEFSGSIYASNFGVPNLGAYKVRTNGGVLVPAMTIDASNNIALGNGSSNYTSILSGAGGFYVSVSGSSVLQAYATGFRPQADNVMTLGTTTQAWLDVQSHKITTRPKTVATLPAGAAGARSFVTDSSVVAAGNFGAIVAGGGANGVPVYSDGTNWRIG